MGKTGTWDLGVTPATLVASSTWAGSVFSDTPRSRFSVSEGAVLVSVV